MIILGDDGDYCDNCNGFCICVSINNVSKVPDYGQLSIILDGYILNDSSSYCAIAFIRLCKTYACLESERLSLS